MFKKIYVADSFLKRLTGLLTMPVLSADEALLITKCNSIHTFFMKYSIDAIFMDKDFNVLGVEENIEPGQISKIYPHGVYVLETAAGSGNVKKSENLGWLGEYVK
ncbi:MAG: DUF192 domain-containing protein [Acetatifactor sp.]|nr:DUF192 domain-containing protein [Acetatifactor sp.]